MVILLLGPRNCRCPLHSCTWGWELLLWKKVRSDPQTPRFPLHPQGEKGHLHGSLVPLHWLYNPCPALWQYRSTGTALPRTLQLVPAYGESLCLDYSFPLWSLLGTESPPCPFGHLAPSPCMDAQTQIALRERMRDPYQSHLIPSAYFPVERIWTTDTYFFINIYSYHSNT